jgi:hypothetical protein
LFRAVGDFVFEGLHVNPDFAAAGEGEAGVEALGFFGDEADDGVLGPMNRRAICSPRCAMRHEVRFSGRQSGALYHPHAASAVIPLDRGMGKLIRLRRTLPLLLSCQALSFFAGSLGEINA